MRCEVAHDPDVRVCGTIGVMTSLEFLQHFLTKLGHGDLLISVTQLISTLSPPHLPGYKHAVASAAPAASSKSPLRSPTSKKAKEKRILATSPVSSSWRVKIQPRIRFQLSVFVRFSNNERM